MKIRKFKIFLYFSVVVILINSFVIVNNLEVVYSRSGQIGINEEKTGNTGDDDEVENKVAIVELSDTGSAVKIDELFENSGDMFAATEVIEEEKFGLGDLFVLDRLFDQGAILNKGSTTLGDLFILERLFRDSEFIFGDDNEISLGELFVLDKLFDGNEILDHGATTMSDLFILDKLFNKN